MASGDLGRLVLLIVSLKTIDIQSTDVQNAFLAVVILEKVHLVAGPEFGLDQGKNLIFIQALYGLKSTGASFKLF